MDMVLGAGKSRKNVDAYVLFPPDALHATEVLISTRAGVGVPQTNPYIFARLSADSPLSGGELSEIADLCPGLVHKDRITSTSLRKYIGTVSQVFY